MEDDEKTTTTTTPEPEKKNGDAPQEKATVLEVKPPETVEVQPVAPEVEAPRKRPSLLARVLGLD